MQFGNSTQEPASHDRRQSQDFYPALASLQALPNSYTNTQNVFSPLGSAGGSGSNHFPTSGDMNLASMSGLVPNTNLWPSNGYMPNLDTSIDQMADLHLHTTFSNESPVSPDDYAPRRTSQTSISEVSEWQEKVRVEVSILADLFIKN